MSRVFLILSGYLNKMDNSTVVFDIELYPNYALFMFKRVHDGKVLLFEKTATKTLDCISIKHLLNNYTLITFNGIKYDDLILTGALTGYSNAELFGVSQDIINDNLQPWQVRKKHGLSEIYYDHIDIMGVAPLAASLKLYAARLHTKKMQDLPYDPMHPVNRDQQKELIRYCENDLDNTLLLATALQGQLSLRAKMSNEYNVDMRSKSDAQIAEAVIKSDFQTKFRFTPKKPLIEPCTQYRFTAPDVIGFKTPVLQKLLADCQKYPFTLGAGGHLLLPDELKKYLFNVGGTGYKFGLGGLHSTEKSTSHFANNGVVLLDYDVASYYPSIILEHKLFPPHLGSRFLQIYKGIVQRRLRAKASGDKTTADTLKITVNGSFGKLASKYSFLYAPDLMMQVTLIGQLSLLMLIETLEEGLIPVISANTDGIVIKTTPSDCEFVSNCVKQWEKQTHYVMEKSEYTALCSRDVNNYIAIKGDTLKAKGAYAVNTLGTNPVSEICKIAVQQFLLDETHVSDTIYRCTNPVLFTTTRTVNGGATYNEKLIGKVIRWYYSHEELNAIFYKKSGNLVPKSTGARPMMNLPNTLPPDLDYEYYVNEAISMINDLGLEV